MLKKGPKNRKKLKIALFLFFLLVIICFPFLNILFAKVYYCGGECSQAEWPKSPAGNSITMVWEEVNGKCLCRLEGGISKLLAYFYEWGIALGGLAAFVALVIAGFRYMTSGGNPSLMQEAMEGIKAAFFGLVLLLASWLILNTINPELTEFRPPSFDPQTPEAVEECDDDSDCKEQGSNCECFFYGSAKSSTSTKGSCLCIEPEAPICDRAELYSESNQQGRVVSVLKAGEKTGGECEDYVAQFLASWRKGLYPQSSQGYFSYGGHENLKDGKCYIFDKKTDTIKDATPLKNCLKAEINPETDVCRCIRCQGMVQLFRKIYCEDMAAEIPATTNNINLDGTIRSGKLSIETIKKEEE